MKALRWLDDHLEGALLAGMLTLLTALVLLQIVMRYVLGSPLSWSEELCRLLLVWSGFFTIGYCVKKGSTIKLDTLVMILPKIVQRVLATVTSLMMMALLCYLLKGAWDLVQATVDMGSLLPGMGIPQYWLYIGPLAGIALGILRLLQSIICSRCFRALTHGATTEGEV